MDWFAKKLAEVEGEMEDNSGPLSPQQQQAASSSGASLAWLQRAGKLASTATDHLKEIGSTAANAASELALREELERMSADVKEAEQTAHLLRQQLGAAYVQSARWRKQAEEAEARAAAAEQKAVTAAATVSPKSAIEPGRGSSPGRAELEEKNAKLKTLLTRLNDAKSQLEGRVAASQATVTARENEIAELHESNGRMQRRLRELGQDSGAEAGGTVYDALCEASARAEAAEEKARVEAESAMRAAEAMAAALSRAAAAEEAASAREGAAEVGFGPHHTTSLNIPPHPTGLHPTQPTSTDPAQLYLYPAHPSPAFSTPPNLSHPNSTHSSPPQTDSSHPNQPI